MFSNKRTRSGPSSLKYYLKSDQPAVRARAAMAAGRIADPAGLLLLKRRLRDRSVVVRRVAAFGLGEAGAPRGRADLQKALEDDDREVRALAAEALSKLGSPKALPSLHELLLREVEGDDLVLEVLLKTAWRLEPESPAMGFLLAESLRKAGDGESYERLLLEVLESDWKVGGEQARIRAVEELRSRVRLQRLQWRFGRAAALESRLRRALERDRGK